MEIQTIRSNTATINHAQPQEISSCTVGVVRDSLQSTAESKGFCGKIAGGIGWFFGKIWQFITWIFCCRCASSQEKTVVDSSKERAKAEVWIDLMFDAPERFAPIFADWVKTWPQNPNHPLLGMSEKSKERNLFAGNLEHFIIRLFMRKDLEKDYEMQMDMPHDVPEQEIRNSIERYKDFNNVYMVTFATLVHLFDITVDYSEDASYPSAGSLVESYLFEHLSTPNKVLKLRNFSTFSQMAGRLEIWCVTITTQCQQVPEAARQLRDVLPLIQKLQKNLADPNKLRTLHQAISGALTEYAN